MLCIRGMHGEHDVNLAGIDLNLLVVLDALLAERHVTRAAAKVGLTQSAASHALARLRAMLGDPILVRGPGGALAIALRGEPAFDPATARRTFRIASADYAEVVLLPALIERLAAQAPGVDLWVAPVNEDPAAALAAGELDIAIGVWRDRRWAA